MTPAPHLDDAARQRQALIGWFLSRNGPFWTNTDERAFQKWLALPGNRKAYTQWQADWDLIDAMPQESTDRLRALIAAEHRADLRVIRPRTPWSEHRRLLVSGVAIAAVSGMTVTGGWLGWQHIQAQPVYEQSFDTRKGQQSDVRLPDGTALRLDTATSLSVAFFRARREIRLAEGQAVFSVSPDAQRPFHVLAGGVQIKVIGTKFSVRLTPGVPGRDGVEVAVKEGKVRVVHADAMQDVQEAASQDATSKTLELTAGQTLVFASNGQSPRWGTMPAEAFATWRSAQLSFSNVPLQEALAEMERYADLGIVSVEPAAGHLRLTGTFDPRDAAAVHRVLSSALPVSLKRGANGLELSLRR